jgi:hypothetical protein
LSSFSIPALLNRHRLGQVARLIDVRPHENGGVIG